MALLPAGSIQADTFQVTKTADTNDGTCDLDCSLREAVGAANANAGADDVLLPAGYYQLDTGSPPLGQISVLDDVDIAGAGPASTIIDNSNQLHSAFSIWPSVIANISDVAIQNGYIGSDGQLTLSRVHISGYLGLNASGSSGHFAAVYLSGPDATLNLIESTIENNNACAVYGAPPQAGSNNAAAVIDRSTISGNSGYFCGGVSIFTAEISNSTISGNSYLRRSGCEDAQLGNGVDAAEALISHSTIAGNADADLSYGQNQLIRLPRCRGCPPPDPPYVCVPVAGLLGITVENSIIEGSCVNPTGVSTPSGGGNVESPGNTCLFDDLTDQVNASALDLGLDVLGDNGGPTETQALLDGSVAIDAAVFANCPMVDQRGFPRPEPGGTKCDAGAFEVPEPSRWLLLAAGLGCLVALYRVRGRI
jgi:CSLREA domain-containing protein